MSKLARIDHERCGESIGWKNGTGYTYVWVSDGVGEDALSALCEKARKSYFDAEDALKKLAPVSPPGYGGTIKGYADGTTVAEIKADYVKKKAAYKDYQELVQKSRKPFSWHLREVSGGLVTLFSDTEPTLECSFDWGHRHGTTVDYGETKMGDYPPATENDEL
jgi:hypothetical protein